MLGMLMRVYDPNIWEILAEGLWCQGYSELNSIRLCLFLKKKSKQIEKIKT